MLEAELIGIDALVTAAILDRKDMRIGDIDPALFVQPDDLVQTFGISIANDRQSAAGDAAVETDEFEMLQHFVRKQLPHLGDLFHQPFMRIKALQIGDGAIGFQNLQAWCGSRCIHRAEPGRGRRRSGAGSRVRTRPRWAPETPYPVIDLLPKQEESPDLGGSMGSAPGAVADPQTRRAWARSTASR